MRIRNAVKGNSELIRKMNVALIKGAIMESRRISRSGLAKKLGLALPTVMRIVDTLIEEGSVIEVGQGHSSGGRKPTMLEMNEDHVYYIGACIQRKLKVVLASAVGNIIARYECIFNYTNMRANILDQVTAGVESVILQAGVPREKVCCIGIGTPGFNFRHNDRVNLYPFAKWANFDIDAWQQPGMLPFPAECENIPKLGALAELRFGVGQNIQDFIFIYADFGIGASVVADGKLYMGSTGVAGEFGHMVIERDGQECYCGRRGCVEMYASSIAILNRIKEEMKSRKCSVNNVSIPSMLQFSDALEELNQKNPMVEAVFSQAGEYLGVGLANLINLLNPRMIIIGGELSNCACYVQSAQRTAQSAVFLHRAERVDIVTSNLGEDDLLIGAIALAMNRVFSSL